MRHHRRFSGGFRNVVCHALMIGSVGLTFANGCRSSATAVVVDAGGGADGDLVPTTSAASLSFTDVDFAVGAYGGDIVIGHATDESTILTYVLYWGTDATTKHTGEPIATVDKTGSDITYPLESGTVPPPSSTHLLVFTANAAGEFATGVACPLTDSSDIDAPTAGNSGALTATAMSVSSIKLDWAAAVDAITASASLQYRVMSAQSIADEADATAAVLGGTPITDWITQITTYTVTGLNENTEYRLGVLVKDAEGNVGVYPAVLSYPADETAPTASNGTTLTMPTVTMSSVDVDWSGRLATDPHAAGGVKYRVIYSTSQLAVDTLAHATVAIEIDVATVAMDWTAGATHFTVNGLSSGTTYYFNVMAKDDYDNILMYTVTGSTTVASPVYVFLATSQVYGDMTTNSNPAPGTTARARGDAHCWNNGGSTFTNYCSQSKTHAFISITGDAISQFTTNYNLPGSASLKAIYYTAGPPAGVIETQVATSWSTALQNNALTTDLTTAFNLGNINRYLWTGANAVGGVSNAGNCSEFESTAGVGRMGQTFGATHFTDYGYVLNCFDLNYLLCVCWQ